MSKDVVWIKLQISREAAEFAERQWQRFAYFSRDDYLNALLNTAVNRAIGDFEREAINRELGPVPKSGPGFDPDEEIPF